MEKIQIKLTKKHLVIVSVVLMVALVIGMGAMTYAKYISSYNAGEQQATAAKWGFVVSADASELFGTDYTKNGEYATVVGTDAGVAVNANTSAGNIVAPGTKGSMTITVSGESEVLAQLKIDADANMSDIVYDIDGDTYYPIKWTVTGLTSGTGTVTGSLQEVLEALEDESAVIQPSGTINKQYTISWEWAFSVNNETDVKDSVIGMLAAGKTYTDMNNSLGTAFTAETDFSNCKTAIQFDLSITVEQIQENP